MKILIVDDEQDICEILKYNLELEGYEVDTANSAEEALCLPLSVYNLLLLDVMMGEMSGFQLAQKLKGEQETQQVPIIFISALDSIDNTVHGLEIGADDYITKPLSIKAVKARVKAVLRRTAPESSMAAPDAREKEKTISYETLHIDLDSKRVTLDNQPVTLTKTEFEILALLVKNTEKVYSRNDLLKLCWPSDTYVLDRTVDVNITRLRKKIGKYGKHICTRFGYGYTFEK